MYITPIPLLALSVSLFLASPIYAIPGTNAIAPRHAHANKSDNAASSSSSSSSSSSGRIASASATTGTRTNHRNSGNLYGGGVGLDNKGNMVCTGKCWYSMEKLQCRGPYVSFLYYIFLFFLFWMYKDANRLGPDGE